MKLVDVCTAMQTSVHKRESATIATAPGERAKRVEWITKFVAQQRC